jgi:PAS domain S-box-containing protein
VRRLRCCLPAIFWIVGLSRPVIAEDAGITDEVPHGQTTFRVFAGAAGLRNLVISSIVEDASGFLWLATEDGVYRFDGDRFTYLSRADGPVTSLVYVVGPGPDGSVCVGVIGLACWNGTEFSRARTRGLPEVAIRTIATFQNRLWVGTQGHGLYVQDDRGGFEPARGWPAPNMAITALWADREGVVVSDGATVLVSSGDDRWRTLGDAGLGSERILGVLRDREGALWIRTVSQMWLLPRGATLARDIGQGLPTRYEDIGASGAMAIGPRGEVVVGTDAGLAIREGDHWHVIERSLGAPGTPTRTLLVDHEGTIWIGSKGLLQLRGRGLVERHDAASGLPGDIVWTYRRDPAGTLWVGTNRCLARAIAGRWECLRGTEGRIVRSIAFPPQGGVFVGGAPSDLLYVDPEGRASSWGGFDARDDHMIMALVIGPEGDLWIATKAGLYRLAGARPGPLEQVAIPGVEADSRFTAFAVAGEQLWIAGNAGLAVHEHGAWRLFDKRAGFHASAMRRVIRRADGRMCASYSSALGVTCFRDGGDRVSDLEHIGPAEGLTTGVVYFLGEDARRRLWIGTGDGVEVVTPGGIDHFDEGDGLAGNDSSANAFLLDDDGALWLGATGGATHLLAQHYAGPPAAPAIAIVGGKLGDRALGTPGVALEVPHDRNALIVELMASTLLDTKLVEYQVRLSPIEPEWTTIHQRQSRYPALPPGAYTLDSRARIGGGTWGPANQLQFAVLPAWWQTRWFIGLGALAVLGALVGAFAWRQRAVLRRRTRQLHARSDASFRAVVDLMPELISVHRDGAMIYMNRAHRRFLGIDTGESGRHPLTEWIHPDDHAHVAELFARVQRLEPEVVSDVIEIRMRGSDGDWRTGEVSGVLVEIAGAPTIVFSGRDVTERKRMRAKLLVSDRMASLGTLAAGIAHEINNPLAYVAGNLEAMAETVEAARASPSPAVCGELSAAIAEARDGAERVRKIVHGLRSFSRSEEEKRVPLALPGVLETAIRLTRNEVRHRAQLVRELGPVPLVIGDDGRLTQVFINLLVNAAHAISEGHSDDNRITVRTRRDDQGRAVAEIEDTGVGMPPEVQARVFDPFFTTKGVGAGTGLGLSICHGIISALGGHISIESAPIRGTVVRVVLPGVIGAIEPVATPPAPVSAAPPPVHARRQRVMLVDDEPQVARTIERLLHRDYDITVALCGREAIEHIVGGRRFDAIVSDVMMPNMTGIELIEELRRVAPDQAERLIFLSGGAFTAQAREQLDQIGVPQLEKPITARELRACVMRVAAEIREPAPGPR